MFESVEIKRQIKNIVQFSCTTVQLFATFVLNNTCHASRRTAHLGRFSNFKGEVAQ